MILTIKLKDRIVKYAIHRPSKFVGNLKNPIPKILQSKIETASICFKESSAWESWVLVIDSNSLEISESFGFEIYGRKLLVLFPFLEFSTSVFCIVLKSYCSKNGISFRLDLKIPISDWFRVFSKNASFFITTIGSSEDCADPF